MAIVIKYVVEHKGVEKLVTTDKKEADKYDKMLEVADNLAMFISAKGIDIPADKLEALSVTLSRHKDAVSKLFKGAEADSVLTADVVEIESRQAS